jgi:hypothetical protein
MRNVSDKNIRENKIYVSLIFEVFLIEGNTLLIFV